MSTMLPVILDACVLYRSQLRDFLLNLAEDEIFLPLWSEEIRDEWIRNLLINRPDISPDNLKRTRQRMGAHFPNSLVHGYESLIPTLNLSAKKDRHVLAAAIHAKAKNIVTFDLGDFPQSVLQRYGIEALLPDDFVVQLIKKSPILVLRAAKKHRLRLIRPSLSVEEYLAMLENQGLPKIVSFLRKT